MLAALCHQDARRGAILARRDRIQQRMPRCRQPFKQSRRGQSAKDDRFRIEEVLDDSDRVAEDGRDLGHPASVVAAPAASRVQRNVAFEAAAIAAGAWFTIRNDRDVADLAGIAPGAAQRAAVMQHGAAEPDAEIEIVTLGMLCAETVEAFAHGGGSHIVFEEGRQASGCCQPLAQRNILPAGHGGRADEAHGFNTERARKRHADTDDAAARAAPGHLGDHGADCFERVVGSGVWRLSVRALDDVAAEIDQRRVDAERGEVDADGITAFRIDTQRRRRQATALRLLANRQDVTLRLQLANDGRNGLDGQSDMAGDIAASNGAEAADGFEHDAPVVRPPEFLIGPPQRHALRSHLWARLAEKIYSVKWNSKISLVAAQQEPAAIAFSQREPQIRSQRGSWSGSAFHNIAESL
ncbi:conserved hypothetical protein [Mesorhizobium sp. SOD10]|nr:conserved hypothetical protein [Mesorhizobium sp. SOD10]